MFLEDIFRVVLDKLNTNEIQEEVLDTLQKILTKIQSQTNNQNEEKKIEQKIDKIKKKREKLIELYMNSNLSIEDFNQKNNELNTEEEKLNEVLKEIKDKVIQLQKTKNKTINFLNLLKEKISNPKIIEEIVKDHVKEIIKFKDKIIFTFYVGKQFEVPLSKYPKRVNNRKDITIMDTKIMYLVNRGCVRYYENMNVEVKLTI